MKALHAGARDNGEVGLVNGVEGRRMTKEGRSHTIMVGLCGVLQRVMHVCDLLLSDASQSFRGEGIEGISIILK